MSLSLGSLIVVKRNLPSVSDLKDTVAKLLEQSVITPLLPPVPEETCTVPSHTLSSSTILAL